MQFSCINYTHNYICIFVHTFAAWPVQPSMVMTLENGQLTILIHLKCIFSEVSLDTEMAQNCGWWTVQFQFFMATVSALIARHSETFTKPIHKPLYTILYVALQAEVCFVGGQTNGIRRGNRLFTRLQYTRSTSVKIIIVLKFSPPPEVQNRANPF